MLDGNEKQNFYSLMHLRDLVVEGSRPLVFWVGAGSSKWSGYPSWNELADLLQSSFARNEGRYDKVLGAELIARGDLPALFSLCRNINSAVYYQKLASALSPRQSTPVYDNFVQLLSSFDPLFVLTTNADEALEQRISRATIVQRSDFERCISLVQRKQSFICKLHGSVSAIEEVIFTNEDYKSLESSPSYLSLLKHLFAEAIVVFIGYGLKDEYVIRALTALGSDFRIFGNGPHFLVTASPPPALPPAIIPIKYFVGMQQDHRSAIIALDILLGQRQFLGVGHARRTSIYSCERSTGLHV